MIKVRKATADDENAVVEILKEVDIYYKALEFKGFWVAEENGGVLGCARLEKFPDFFYLSCVATAPSRARSGVARAILTTLLKGLKKDVYLYTIMPDLFKKFGFRAAEPARGMPTKERYECEACHPERCVTMVRRANDTRIS